MKAALWLLALVCLTGSVNAAINPANVVILVNESDDESIDLGYYYALKREVPIENILHLPLSADEIISWDEYLDTLYNPMSSWLIKGGWFEGFTSERQDDLGRNINIVNDHKVEALVVCKGVPLKISHDRNRMPSEDTYSNDRKPFYTNRASVDSELALLPLPKANIDAFYPNPMFRRTESRNLFDVNPLVVGRLDGPDYELAKSLIDRALEAEEGGIAGRVYVDIGGPHDSGDQWFEKLVSMLEKKGFDVDAHREKGQFNRIDRFDEPLLYFGWYSGGVVGPFTNYRFQFPTGAIALHLHSFTATTVRDYHKYWVGPLIRRGVTGTFGNTSEPYLYFTHHPHLIVEALFKGLSLGQAALYAHPGLSWVSIYIGDPLYQPPIDLRVPPKNQYDVIRMANLALIAGNSTAFKAVVTEHEQTHHYSTGLWLYDYFMERGDKVQAYQYLDSTKRPRADAPSQWGVLVAMARAYFRLEKKDKALPILNDLFHRMKESTEAQIQLLNRALEFAEEFELTEQETVWQSELDALTAPKDE